MNNKEGYYHCENHRDHCQAIQESDDKCHRTYEFAKIANPRDRGLPIPSGSGNTADISWKLLHFWIPWFINNIPKMIRTANSNKDTFVVFDFVGNKNYKS